MSRRPPASASSHLRRSFTLVEMLAALALTGLLVTLTGGIAVHVARSRQDVEKAILRMERDAAVFDAAKEDLRRMLSPMHGEDVPLRLFQSDGQVLEIQTLVAVSENDSLHQPWHPATVRYRLSDDKTLVREVIDRTVPGATPVPETIAADIKRFALSVKVKEQWMESFPPANAPQVMPTAMRLTIGWSDGASAAKTMLVNHAE